ncbi:MAG: AAA family ATPase [Clostridiales Family XIII bacterium]|jgi:AAA15 family ATPase/GTPase|nr:AAA family ATPase [Clostridiales Family XIII bacterium]
MAIKRVELKDFLVFKGEFTADFCPGVNVFIGGNGTGKTILLKAMYDNIKTIIDHRAMSNVPGKMNFVNGQESLSKDNVKTWPDATGVSQAVYIPEKDILEHAKGLLTFVDQKDNDFSSIYRDVLITAQDSDNRKQTDTQKAITATITEKVGGRVEWAPGEERYYTIRADGTRIPFSNEASGFKKLGYLELLVRCGHLEPGSVLFWDEPENSLNPELVPILVDILLELSRNGVQIFIATHSEILAEYFAVLHEKSKGDEVKFFSLYKYGDRIRHDNGDRFDLLNPNKLIDEPVRLYEKRLDKVFGDE